VIACPLARDRKYIIVIVIILLTHGIYMNYNWRPDGTRSWIWTWIWLGERERALVVFVPPVSIEYRPLLGS
jgi:hypothetical protein